MSEKCYDSVHVVFNDRHTMAHCLDLIFSLVSVQSSVGRPRPQFVFLYHVKV